MCLDRSRSAKILPERINIQNLLGQSIDSIWTAQLAPFLQTTSPQWIAHCY